MRLLFVCRRTGYEIEILRAVKGPQHIEMGKALNVHQARLVLAQDFKHAFGFVFCAESARNLRRFLEGALNKADRLECEHGGESPGIHLSFGGHASARRKMNPERVSTILNTVDRDTQQGVVFAAIVFLILVEIPLQTFSSRRSKTCRQP